MSAIGASQSAAVEDVSSAVVNSMFEINTLAPIRFTRALLPFMLSREKGRLVIVASMVCVPLLLCMRWSFLFKNLQICACNSSVSNLDTDESKIL